MMPGGLVCTILTCPTVSYVRPACIAMRLIKTFGRDVCYLQYKLSPIPLFKFRHFVLQPTNT